MKITSFGVVKWTGITINISFKRTSSKWYIFTGATENLNTHHILYSDCASYDSSFSSLFTFCFVKSQKVYMTGHCLNTTRWAILAWRPPFGSLLLDLSSIVLFLSGNKLTSYAWRSHLNSYGRFSGTTNVWHTSSGKCGTFW